MNVNFEAIEKAWFRSKKTVLDELEEELRKIRQKTFTKYHSNEWNNCLSFNDDIKPLLDKIQELKKENENGHK